MQTQAPPSQSSSSSNNENTTPPTNELLTPASLALSLSAPRAPPHGTIHRSLLTKRRQSSLFLPRKDFAAVSAPHPHLPTGLDMGLRMSRGLAKILPLEWQNHFREW
mmetsp:Transcript_61324/g.72834  ORF Transcript_61324/g.72834 Transcript_61324/m.72834 type:complete len:107 (+) Transcript_61324:91-411(+)